VKQIAWSPDGRTLTADDGEGSVFVWDAATGKVAFRLSDDGGYLIHPSFAPDGRIITFGDAVRIWNPDRGTPDQILPVCDEGVGAAYVDRAGRHLLAFPMTGRCRCGTCPPETG
jgi:Tol biopolymer transport system component